MIIKNFYQIDRRWNDSHESGQKSLGGYVLKEEELDVPIRFVRYTTYPPGSGVGRHTHGNDQELYIILEGSGVVEVNGEKRSVAKGDVIVNPPYGTHALYNTSDQDLSMLLFEVYHKEDSQ